MSILNNYKKKKKFFLQNKINQFIQFNFKKIFYLKKKIN
jgi:hypothetical protein